MLSHICWRVFHEQPLYEFSLFWIAFSGWNLHLRVFTARRGRTPCKVILCLSATSSNPIQFNSNITLQGTWNGDSRFESDYWRPFLKVNFYVKSKWGSLIIQRVAVGNRWVVERKYGNVSKLVETLSQLRAVCKNSDWTGWIYPYQILIEIMVLKP